MEGKVGDLENEARLSPHYYSFAAKQARELLLGLQTQLQSFEQQVTTYEELQVNCVNLINEKRPTLDKLDGWGAFLSGLIRVINGFIYAFSFTYVDGFFKAPKVNMKANVELFETTLEGDSNLLRPNV